MACGKEIKEIKRSAHRCRKWRLAAARREHTSGARGTVAADIERLTYAGSPCPERIAGLLKRTAPKNRPTAFRLRQPPNRLL